MSNRCFMFALAFLSMLYELNLAQTLATLFGNSALRYATTIGLFLFSAGLGSILYEKLKGRQPTRDLIWAEVALALLGFLSPFVCIWLEPFSPIAAFVCAHVFIIGIGALTGLELPLIVARDARSPRSSYGAILAADYLGSVAATIAFPLWILPSLGVFLTAAGSGLLNALVAVALAYRQSLGERSLALSALLICSVLMLLSPQMILSLQNLYGK